MSGFLNLPDFEARELLTAAQLTQIVTALQGFSAQSADITWPLVAGGDLDFDKLYGIVGLRTLWNIVNASEYDTLQAAVDAAEAMTGGTCVFIPPSETIPADGVSIEADNIWIVGCGDSSVIQATGSTGYAIRTSGGARSNIGLMNLRMDGDSVAGQDGIQFRYTDGITVKGVRFEDWDGSALVLTNAGSDGTEKCQNAFVTDCVFTGGAGAHIECIDLDGGSFDLLVSDSATATAALDFEPASAAGFIKDITLSNVRITGTTGIGVQILGAAAVFNANWSLIDLSNVTVTGATGNAFVVGDTLKILKSVKISGCSAPSTANGAIPLTANIDLGHITGCFFQDATPDSAIDLTLSDTISVHGNNVINAGTPAIDLTGVVAGTVQCGSNPGDFGPTHSNIYIDDTDHTLGGTTTGDMGFLKTISGGSVRPNDIVRVVAAIDGVGNGTVQLQLEGVGSGSTTISADSHVITWYIKVGTGAGGTSYLRSHVSDLPAVTTDHASITVDWTADVDVTFNCTAHGGAGDITVARGVVELVGSE